MDRQAELQPLLERWRAATGQFAGHCALCQVSRPKGAGLVEQHEVLGCPTMLELLKKTNHNERRQSGEYLDWRRQLRYQPSSGACSRCHIPFLQDQLHGANTGSGRQRVMGCKAGWSDMVGPMVYWAYYSEKWRTRGEQMFRVEWGNDVAFAAWLMEKVNGERYLNMCRFWLWLVEEWLAE